MGKDGEAMEGSCHLPCPVKSHRFQQHPWKSVCLCVCARVHTQACCVASMPWCFCEVRGQLCEVGPILLFLPALGIELNIARVNNCFYPLSHLSGPALLSLINFYVLWVFCLLSRAWVSHLCAWGQKWASELLELESQMVVTHHTGAGKHREYS